MVTTLAAGLLPALRVSRPDLAPVLKGETPSGKSRSWFRGSLIVAQIACSQFLLVGTGLLVGSYFQVQHIRPGFDMGRHVLFATMLPNAENPNLNYEDMLGRLRALPGVRRVSSVGNPPLSGSGGGAQQVSIPGVTGEPVGIAGNAVGPEYFTAMGTAILRGRDFTKSDSAGTAIVNEQMARRFWGDAGRAIGQFIRVDGKDRQIVGVVETGKYQWLLEQPTPFFFLFTPGAGTLLIETAGDPAAMAGAVRKTFREEVTGVTLNSLVTLRQQMSLAFFVWQAACGVVGDFRDPGNLPVGRWAVWRGVVRSHSPHPRDWRAHGDGGAPSRCVETGPAAGPFDGGDWGGDWHGRRGGGSAGRLGGPLSGKPGGPASTSRSRAGSGGSHLPSHSGAGAESDSHRPHDGSARRVGVHTALRLFSIESK